MARRFSRAAAFLLLAGLIALGSGGVTTAQPRPGAESGRVGVGGEAQPAWLRPILAQVNVAQRRLNQALSRELRRLKEGDAGNAALAVAGIAFLYGVLHAVGPGHGKLVVSSLFLGRDARLSTAVAVSGLVSLLQTMSAIAIVAVVALLLGRGGLGVLRDSRRVELVSYGLIAVIGLGMLVGSLHDLWRHRPGTGSPRPRNPQGGDASAARRVGGVSGSLVLATGLTPCASAVILLLFAVGHGVFLVGIAAALVMAVGMGITLSAVGLVAVATRRGAVRVVGGSPGRAYWLKGTLGVLGATGIAALGVLLFLGVWSQAS